MLFKSCYFPESFSLSENKSVINYKEDNQIENILHMNDYKKNSENIFNTHQENPFEQLVKEVTDLSQKYISLKETISKLQFEIEKVRFCFV